MKIIDCEQGSEEWHAARCGIPTASEFATILSKGKGSEEAVGRAKYRRRLVLERISGRVLESGHESAAMRQGTEREPLARAEYMMRGEYVQKVGFCRHDDLECGASPDGLVGDDGGVEIKCPELLAHGDTWLRPKKDIPPAHIAQVQGNMWITKRAWWDFVSHNPEYPGKLATLVIRVPRNDDYIAQLAFMVAAFIEEVRNEEAALRRLM